MSSSSSPLTLPPWLSTAKDLLLHTRQWTTLVRRLHLGVSSDLTSRSLKFSELKGEEQQALVEKVYEELCGEEDGDVRGFERAVNSVVDTEIAAEVRRIGEEESKEGTESSEGVLNNHRYESPRGASSSSSSSSKLPSSSSSSSSSSSTSTDIGSANKIVEVSISAVISLLSQLPPEHRTLTRLMLGQPFPSQFRAAAWALQLKHATARASYESLVSRRRVDTISTMDGQITQAAQSFLQKHPSKIYTRRRLAVMKTTLSYHHTLLLARGQSTTLRPSLFSLASPLVYVQTGGASPGQELPQAEEREFVVGVVEAFEALAGGAEGVGSLEGGDDW